MSDAISLDAYRENLTRMSEWVNPTIVTDDMRTIEAATESLSRLPAYDLPHLSEWARANPRDVNVLGLAVGLSQEKLKNNLKAEFDTSGWITLAREQPEELIDWFISAFELNDLLEQQFSREYDFGDVLVARAGSRVTAKQAGMAGRKLEDLIEEIAADLGLDYKVRGRFTGRRDMTAPCDLVIPGDGKDALIAVAAKGFDSTGSKLTDAVREIEQMAEVRRPQQFIMAVVDGIGWKNRGADLARIHELWATNQIDGMYTVSSLDQFREDLHEAAVRLRLL